MAYNLSGLKADGYLKAVSEIKLAVLHNSLHLRGRFVLQLVITDDQEVDVLLLGQLDHLEKVSAEQSRKPNDVVVKVQTLDRVRQCQLVLARARAFLPWKLAHDELRHSHPERNVKKKTPCDGMKQGSVDRSKGSDVLFRMSVHVQVLHVRVQLGQLLGDGDAVRLRFDENGGRDSVGVDFGGFAEEPDAAPDQEQSSFARNVVEQSIVCKRHLDREKQFIVYFLQTLCFRFMQKINHSMKHISDVEQFH